MRQSRSKVFFKFVLVLFFVYLFLVSISLMGVAFKGFGKGFSENLLKTTSNPFIGLFIGILATSIIQSSSTTTSIIVGMVASGVMTISNAIPIIMGANIGTTVTNTFVSLGHITRREEFKRAIAGATVHDFFNITCVTIMFPLELATGFLHKIAAAFARLFVNCGGVQCTSPIKLATQPVISFIESLFIDVFRLTPRTGYILILAASIILLFLSLCYIVRLMKSIVMERTEVVLNNVLERRGVIAIFAGLIFTAIIQSSSITTSLLVPLIGTGILTVEGAFPIVLGANVGTTTTALLASLATGNVSALTIAFVHFLFNVFGVVFIYPIKPLRRLPIRLAKGLGGLAFKKRRYALLYSASVFFLIPIILILISKLFK